LIWHRSDQNIRLVLQVSVKVFFVGFGWVWSFELFVGNLKLD
jgi:hypothetical protein